MRKYNSAPPRTERNEAVQNMAADLRASMYADAVIHHTGLWFDPNVIASSAEITIHLVVLNEDLVDVPSLGQIQGDLLYWVRLMADKMHGNVRSKILQGIDYMERLKPYVKKGDFDKDVLFFSQLRRTNALIERTLVKRGEYGNKLKQRFAYLRVALARHKREIDMDKLYIFRVDKQASAEMRRQVGESKTNQILENIMDNLIQ